MNDLMLDTETLGVRPTSVITQIGACYFDRYTGEVGNKYCINIEIGSALMAGLTIDQQTVDWWKQQPFKSWMYDLYSINKAVDMFNDFVKDAPKTLVWSHATFDFVLITNMYKVLNRKFPFHYRSARDIRTLVDLAQLRYEPKEIKTHNALEDCERQVKYCVECFNKLRNKLRKE